MSRRTNFLDGNDNFREQNLRFVRNEYEDNLNQFFGGAPGNNSQRQQQQMQAPPRDSLIVQPTPGFCVKSFKVNSNEKFFINVCQAPEVPAPPVDVTEEELIAILESPDPGSFRVPMSISEPRHTKDRSNNTVDVVDIAINPKFLVKINKSQLFNNFFLQIVTEALSEKYNIQISTEKTIVLNNRKFIGTLVSHRVRNDDVKVVNQITSPTSPEGQQLVQEINAADVTAVKTPKVQSSPIANSKEPIYKLRARVRDDVVDEIYVELYLPICVSSQELSLDIGEDRILVESIRHDYLFDKFLNYRLQQDRAQALFDKTSKMLQIRIPVHAV
ncbi:PIH1 domain-containing protein 1 isoform X4 [Drosophila tropicalis]|uniref:PIH1 domain-containing protein 1 isoform X4 n=1 Tax=Drosophila tropicalis TaxID=46794 RepID=UPI0035ABB54B